MSTPVVLKKCGVRFQPPAIIITYLQRGKLHRRTMPLRNFTKHTGVSRVAEELKNADRHQRFLKSVPLHQLEKLISIIRDKLNGISVEDSLKKSEEMNKIDPEQDLNKCDETTLQRKKAVMESSFEAHQKKIGDPDFQYDVEVDFDPAGVIETCDWDSGDDDDDGGF